MEKGHFFAYSIIIQRTATGIVKRKAWFQRNDYYRCHQCQRKTGSGRPPIGYDAPWFVHEIPTMFISIANPYHMQDVPMIETFINAYTANEFNVEMLVKKINGESSFKGKNPVDPFCYQRQTRTI
ncbi:hypothetical protein [Roseburia sp. AF42-8]|uniref:hypothetical protein n=1 Tax=Roseburia sp. AF42-8 TaxID=2293137 RepID=UPI001FA877D4|nr:hypothetical protein [Roseburia sp. AF42-8]